MFFNHQIPEQIVIRKSKLGDYMWILVTRLFILYLVMLIIHLFY